LFDALFFAQRGKIALPDFKPSADSSAILCQIQDAMERGRQLRAIQLSPHPVLLHPMFYHEHLKAPMSRWAMLWLRCRTELASVLGPNGGTPGSQVSGARVMHPRAHWAFGVLPYADVGGPATLAHAEEIPLHASHLLTCGSDVNSFCCYGLVCLLDSG
jgi:hypothetical protein